MHLTKITIILSSLLIILSCQKATQQEEVTTVDSVFQFEWQAMTANLMERMNLEPGEKVLLVASPGRFDPMVPILKDWIEQARGQYLGTISVDSASWPAEWKTEFTEAVDTRLREELAEKLKVVDIAIMLPGANTTHAPYVAMQEVLKGGNGRTIHFHWSGAYTLDGSTLEITEDIDRVYQTAILSTDYKRLSALHQFFEEAARRDGIRVTTPLGTDLRFTLGDRAVTRQGGDASRAAMAYARNLIDREIEIPAGAIRVAPIEESVEGKIAFPDGKWNNQVVKGLVVNFKEGKITDMNATIGLDAVQEELKAAGPSGYSFREFALGFNPWLVIPEIGPRWIPYYGYGAGVVRLSLGDNTELGGKVSGGYVRWNFFSDATVTVGDKVLVKDGKMMQ